MSGKYKQPDASGVNITFMCSLSTALYACDCYVCVCIGEVEVKVHVGRECIKIMVVFIYFLISVYML